MNKNIFTIIRILRWGYSIAVVLYFAILIYNLELKPVAAPVSTVPSLSVSLLSQVTTKLNTRLSISPTTHYGTSSGTLFGKIEPFTQ